MEWRAKVELFEEIRREYEFGIGTVRGVARKLGVHRRQVRQALADAQPPARKQPERRRPVLAGLMPFIEAILTSDRQAPRKQRHTAHRIGQRIRRNGRNSWWRNRRFASTCANASGSWAGRRAPPECRRVTRRGRKARSIGTKAWAE